MDGATHRLQQRRRWRGSLLLTVALLGVTPALAQTAPPPKLRVLVTQEPPFVIRDGQRFTGWAIDLWTEVARQLGVEWEIVGSTTPAKVVDALAAGQADLGVGDISVTRERDERIDFSHPFFRSGLKILTRGGHGESLLSTLASLVTPAHISLAAGVIVLLAMMSTLVYVLARRHDADNFPAARDEGIVEAVYIASGALLKGQLDRKLLPGIFGRILTIVWMFLGAAAVAYVTAAVAAVLTVQRLSSEIHDVDDLTGKPTAAVTGTFTVGWLTQQGIPVDEEPDVDAAARALLDRRVIAVVHDSPVLAWWVARHPTAPVQLVGHTFDRNDYAFAVPEGSPLRVRINLPLLTLQESGFFNELDRRWLAGGG